MDGALCGLAGLEIPQGCNKRHKGTLFGVYVCPDRRRAGLGHAVVTAVIEHARGSVEQLHAAVVTTAHPARALYRKLGFEPYGLEPRALKVGQEYFDQELLVLRLEGRPGTSGRPVRVAPAVLRAALLLGPAVLLAVAPALQGGLAAGLAALVVRA